jgi:hypothetical protein
VKAISHLNAVRCTVLAAFGVRAGSIAHR